MRVGIEEAPPAEARGAFYQPTRTVSISVASQPVTTLSRLLAAPLLRVPHPQASRAVRATHLLAPQPGETIATAVGGLLLEVNPRERKVVDSGIYHHRGYELGTLQLMRQHVGPSDVVWDIGAYIGLMSLYAWQLGAQVHAFEPNPPIRQVLERNVELNDADVTVHPFALGENRGVATLYESAENAGAANLVHRNGVGVQVKVERGDDLPLPAPTFVKVDVETFESRVIRGMPDKLTGRPLMCVEYTPGDQDTIPLLHDLGYRPFVQGGGKDTLTRLRPMRRPPTIADNVWWFPPGHPGPVGSRG